MAFEFDEQFSYPSHILVKSPVAYQISGLSAHEFEFCIDSACKRPEEIQDEIAVGVQ